MGAFICVSSLITRLRHFKCFKTDVTVCFVAVGNAFDRDVLSTGVGVESRPAAKKRLPNGRLMSLIDGAKQGIS